MKSKRQWVLWKNVVRSGEPTKVPFQTNGSPAKANDPSTWNEFSTCVQKISQYDGIGFEFSVGGGLVGVDIDGCRNPETGEVADWAREIIRELDTYAEVSPSKTGVKLFALGINPFESGRKKEVDQPKVTAKTPAIEVYDRARYFAVTGWRLKGPEEPQPRQDAIDALCKKFFNDVQSPKQRQEFYGSDAVLDRARKYIAKIPGAVSGQNGHNATFHVACVLIHGFNLNEQDAMAALSEWNAGCQPPWSEKELNHKIQSACKTPGERGYLRNVAIEQWSTVDVPQYEQKNKQQKPEPRITTLKDAASNYIETLKAGKAELIELGLADVDYAVGGGVERSEMIILAARPSHGKSAIALQCAHTWTYSKRPVLMISEEMSAHALGKRTLQFISETPEEHWRTSVKSLENDLAYYNQSRAPCLIAESCGTADAACEQIDKAVKEHGVQCVIVDYAQLLRSPGKSRYEQVTQTSIMLKQAASHHRIVLMMLCQLNREIESRTKFTPTMSDIKDTGQLEQDADVIMFLVWPYMIDSAKPSDEYFFFVAKNRNRAIMQRCVKQRFVPSRQMVLPPKIQDAKNYSPAFEQYNNQ